MTMLALIGRPFADAWGMHGDLGAGWWVVLVVGMVLLWAVVILGLVWLVRDGIERSQRRDQAMPLAPLDRRFAEGALSVDEYHQCRDALLRERASQSNQGAGSRQSERTQP
jgi:uncharacterized membrane protein